MKAYHHLIKGPIITEKTHSLREAANKLTFRVDVKANKIEIRKAIEDIVQGQGPGGEHHPAVMGKKKKLGKTEGKRPDWKKAIVTLAPGEKIAGFEGL